MECADSGKDFNLYIAPFFPFHFKNEGSHTVYSGISGTNDANSTPLFRVFESKGCPILLFFHAGVDAFRFGTNDGPDEVEVIFITDHNVRLHDGCTNGGGNVFFAARPDAGDEYFSVIHYM